MEMKEVSKSEWFELDSPIGEPHISWPGERYQTERIVNKHGDTIWFGQAVNWKKVKGGE